MTQITDVQEALALLKELVRRGRVLKRNLPAIKLMVENHFGMTSTRSLNQAMALVPAMVAGAKALLEGWDKSQTDHNWPEPRHQGEEHGVNVAIGWMVLKVANAYAPAMRALGWVPK